MQLYMHILQRCRNYEEALLSSTLTKLVIYHLRVREPGADGIWSRFSAVHSVFIARFIDFNDIQHLHSMAARFKVVTHH
jgi:hypothetical protein